MTDIFLLDAIFFVLKVNAGLFAIGFVVAMLLAFFDKT
jgi:hypothetical protein